MDMISWDILKYEDQKLCEKFQMTAVNVTDHERSLLARF